MFKRTVNLVESGEGYSVEVLGRTGLRYTEGEKRMHIDSEVLNASEIAVVESSIQAWDSPFEAEVIDDKKRAVILENIRRAFTFMNAIMERW
ncbi:MAG: hypothetical protein KJZ77_11675 [Anaerolineales bacterium]|jgi:hypothetical protein|nr:hypothetical protein [Anaerolineales bacterium]